MTSYFDKLNLRSAVTIVDENGVPIPGSTEALAELLASDSIKSTSLAPEFLTISATTTTTNANFSTYAKDTIQEVAIQNLDDMTDVYVTFSSTAAPTATTNQVCIPAGASMSLVNTDYIYFAAITAADTATIRIVGLG